MTASTKNSKIELRIEYGSPERGGHRLNSPQIYLQYATMNLK